MNLFNRKSPKPLKTVPGAENTTVKSKGFIHNATDTFHELILILLAVVGIGGILYSLFEKGVSVGDGIWWAFVTAFTVGYGDTVPHTTAGRVLGILLMSFTVFVIIPLITARMASKMIVNDDAWTNDEQENVKNTLARINEKLNAEDNQAKMVTVGKLKKSKANSTLNTVVVNSGRAVPQVAAVKRGRGRPRKNPLV